MVEWWSGRRTEHARGATRKKKEIAMSVKRVFKRDLDNKCARLFRPGGCRHSWQLAHPPLLRQLTCYLSCRPERNKSMNTPSREADYAYLINLTKLRQKKSHSQVSFKLTIARGSRTSEYINWRGFFQPEEIMPSIVLEISRRGII